MTFFTDDQIKQLIKQKNLKTAGDVQEMLKEMFGKTLEQMLNYLRYLARPIPCASIQAFILILLFPFLEGKIIMPQFFQIGAVNAFFCEPIASSYAFAVPIFLRHQKKLKHNILIIHYHSDKTKMDLRLFIYSTSEPPRVYRRP